MAHEIETMFSVRELPWHGLGTVLESAPSVADAIRAAGLDWDVELRPVVTVDGAAVPGTFASVRTSDGRVLGCVGSSYAPLQNREAFAFFDPFLAAGEATLETAGSLREGSRIWILARLARDPSVIAGDDEVRKYILLANGHDGSLCVQVGFVPIRVVCANTLALAQRSKASRLLRVRHQKNVAATLTALHDVMNTANAEFEATAEQFRWLASRGVDEDDLRRYVRTVFSRGALPSAGEAAPEVVDAEIALDEPAERGGRLFDSVRRLFESGRGNDRPAVRGTWWAAYNAVTEYLAHERGGDRDTRINSLWFAGGSRLNERALKAALVLAS